MSSPGSPGKWGNSMETFGKHGITYDDHHFKDKEGAYQGSPPGNLKVRSDAAAAFPNCDSSTTRRGRAGLKGAPT